jgi:Transposase IS116/IS110/IS902 family/Methyltransferase domain
VARSFDELVAEAVAVPVEGWDFSWLEGRATEQRPSWGYQRLLGERLSLATAPLDIQTGGGEVLAGAGSKGFPPTMVATEGWPPNLAKATELLHPLGVVVVADDEDPPLPFADGAFDLVTSRHPATVHWSEITRVLASGGTYLAQHVGGGTNVEISEYFLGSVESGDVRTLDAIAERLSSLDGMVARIAADLVERIRSLTITARALDQEITQRITSQAPCLLALIGVGALTAAKIVAEVADVRRFKSKDAFARHNGTAPLPAWSGNPNRHRLSRTGNRQLNAAIHRIAITQLRYHPAAQAFRDRRVSTGDTTSEALRALKRRLSDAVFRALLADATLDTRPLTKAP